MKGNAVMYIWAQRHKSVTLVLLPFHHGKQIAIAVSSMDMLSLFVLNSKQKNSINIIG